MYTNDIAYHLSVWDTPFIAVLKSGMVAHPVTQVIGEQAIVDIPDQSKVS